MLLLGGWIRGGVVNWAGVDVGGLEERWRAGLDGQYIPVDGWFGDVACLLPRVFAVL